ncbi:MAG: YwaF family protein, partial [Christensenellaceae bacterium]|nr:YwaF family protein [Christensenellaceae bacterium]
MDKFLDFFRRKWIYTTLKWVVFAVFAFGLFFTYLWQETSVNYIVFGQSFAFGGNDAMNDFMLYMWWFLLPASLVCVFRLMGYRDGKVMRWLNAVFAFPVATICLISLPNIIKFMTGGGTPTEAVFGTITNNTLTKTDVGDIRLAVIGMITLVITCFVVSLIEFLSSFIYANNYTNNAGTKSKKSRIDAAGDTLTVNKNDKTYRIDAAADTLTVYPNGKTSRVYTLTVKNGKMFRVRVWECLKENYTLDWRDLLSFVLALFGILICTMPCFALFGLFGYGETQFTYELGVVHRTLCYFAFIIPIVVYLCTFWQKPKARRLVSLFMAWGLLFVYGANWYLLDTINDPFELPLHLCNTIMFVIPIVLTFKMNKVFYFTLFINVFGAFAAMFFPTDRAEMRYLFAPDTVQFWINHWTAFFIPVVCIALGQFKRPKFRHFVYSMIAFALYFGLVLFINPLFTAMGHEKDYFFLNSDTITGVLGKWAEDLQIAKKVVTFRGYQLTFMPVYQTAFFFVYCGLAVGVWFLYEVLFKSADGLALSARVWHKDRQDHFALLTALDGRKATEPVDIKGVDMIQIKHFSKRYGSSGDYAVRDISLEVHAGEVFGFLGPNGAGKSTVIKSLVGIQSITEGEINICGFDVEKQPIEAKRQIGFVPDNYALYEKLTGREYVNYFADIYRVTHAARTERIEKMLDQLEIRYAFDSQIRTYSHGMKQKIAIMSALIHDPKVWILDEPMTGLDPNSVFAIKKSMIERAKAGNIVFFSSHIIDLVERVCNRIAIIKKGRIIDIVSVEDIIKSGVTLEKYYMDKIGFKGAERGLLEYGELNPFAEKPKKIRGQMSIFDKIFGIKSKTPKAPKPDETKADGLQPEQTIPTATATNTTGEKDSQTKNKT